MAVHQRRATRPPTPGWPVTPSALPQAAASRFPLQCLTSHLGGSSLLQLLPPMALVTGSVSGSCPSFPSCGSGLHALPSVKRPGPGLHLATSHEYTLGLIGGARSSWAPPSPRLHCDPSPCRNSQGPPYSSAPHAPFSAHPAPSSRVCGTPHVAVFK